MFCSAYLIPLCFVFRYFSIIKTGQQLLGVLNENCLLSNILDRSVFLLLRPLTLLKLCHSDSFQDPTPSSTSLTTDDVVDIKDVELTLLPSYLHDDAKTTQKEETSIKSSPAHQPQPPPSVPKRPPRNGGTNVEGESANVGLFNTVQPKRLFHFHRSNDLRKILREYQTQIVRLTTKAQ